MSNGIHPPEWPSRRGPWPEVDGPSRLYDHGWPWCVNAWGHPDERGGYPDPARHLPWFECRGREAFVDEVRRDLDGEPVTVSVYAAAAFRFGQPRHDGLPVSPRVVVETWSDRDDEHWQRVSLTVGEALRLARILVRCADELTFGQRVA
jgi:hypothetical protein